MIDPISGGFPRPLDSYPPAAATLIDTLWNRAAAEPFNAIATAIFGFVVGIAGFAAGWLLGARHVTLVAPSPSGDLVAYILEARCALGRCQSLKIGTGSNARVVNNPLPMRDWRTLTLDTSAN